MYIRHRNRRLRVSEISSNTDQNDASFLMNDAVTGVEANIVQAKSLYRSRAGPHCAFSSNLFHGHIVQKYIDQMSPPENKKCSPGKVFGIKPPSNLATFEQERP